jgi:glycosyltransferase involved in cell wall biosynthesis
MPKLSVVIITLNEEKNIRRCLESIQGVADEIVIVDSYSTDRTKEICDSFGVRFIQHTFNGHIEQKNWAISQARYPHILSLDADELLSEQLRSSILHVKENWEYDGYYFNRLTNYCGKWIKHASWYPSRKLRLWDSRKGAWGGMNPHDQFILNRGSSRKFIKGDLLHYSYYSIQQHLVQLNKFSNIAAESLFKIGKRSSYFNILFHPGWRFIRDYFIKLGFLDGFYGLVICLNSAHETFLKYAKLRQLCQDAENSAKVRICFFNSLKTWGGGEKWHYDLSTRLNGLGYDTFICADPNSELLSRIQETEIDSFSVSVRNLSFINPIKILRLRNLFKRQKVQTIILNLSSDLKTAGIAAKMAGVDDIVYRRASAIPVRNTLLNRYLFRKVITRMIANSEETKRSVLVNNPNLINENKITVIYNGIDLSERSSGPVKPAYVRENNELILGNAGRLSAEKGQIYLIHLAEILKKNGVSFKILIAGTGKLKSWLQKQARLRGVENEIVFLGFLDELFGFYSNIDIFLLTSLWEGFGYVMVEAMALKKPVIAFDIRSSGEVVDDGNTGFLVPRGDVEAMAEKVMELAGDQVKMKALGSNGLERVESMFTIDQVIAEVRNFLKVENGVVI